MRFVALLALSQKTLFMYIQNILESRTDVGELPFRLPGPKVFRLRRRFDCSLVVVFYRIQESKCIHTSAGRKNV